MTQPKDILDFWFSAEIEPFWFNQSDAVDAEITTRFGLVYEEARQDALKAWCDEAESALALMIVLDQFPRNMFRGSGRAFESGALAINYAEHALKNRFDRQVNDIQRPFFYLPFMHSEALADQDKCVRLYEELGTEMGIKFAVEHRDIIAKFGRFPHRNKALGRESSAEELAFLETHSGF